VDTVYLVIFYGKEDILWVLQDPQFLMKSHQRVGSKDSFSNMRILYYPPISPSRKIKPGQLRCGEHIDYGSLSLLFQDPNGGLQVKKSLALPQFFKSISFVFLLHLFSD